MKKSGDELDEGAAIPCVNRFIGIELLRLAAIANTLPEGTGRPGVLDGLFREMVCGDPTFHMPRGMAE